MNTYAIVLAIIAAYLLGSIPFGYLLVRIYRGADVRATGSGNIGATNVARTSPVLGVITLLLDGGKGIASVVLVSILFPRNDTLAFAAALAVICGHMFPLWLRFRGGKGVATGLGSFVLLTPKAVVVAIGVFIVMVVAFRWIALASITAAGFLPLIGWLMGELGPTQVPTKPALHFANAPLIFLCTASALVIVKHHANIRRIMAGTEPRLGRNRS